MSMNKRFALYIRPRNRRPRGAAAREPGGFGGRVRHLRRRPQRRILAPNMASNEGASSGPAEAISRLTTLASAAPEALAGARARSARGFGRAWHHHASWPLDVGEGVAPGIQSRVVGAVRQVRSRRAHDHDR